MDIEALAEVTMGENRTSPVCKWQVVQGCLERPVDAPTCTAFAQQRRLPYCLNGGVCLHVWASLRCSCEMTTFTGNRCHLRKFCHWWTGMARTWWVGCNSACLTSLALTRVILPIIMSCSCSENIIPSIRRLKFIQRSFVRCLSSLFHCISNSSPMVFLKLHICVLAVVFFSPFYKAYFWFSLFPLES